MLLLMLNDGHGGGASCYRHFFGIKELDSTCHRLAKLDLPTALVTLPGSQEREAAGSLKDAMLKGLEAPRSSAVQAKTDVRRVH